MLIQFTVENHRSIKDSAVLSFAASKDKSFEEYLLHPNSKRSLLPVIGIYGANAAGKSNVLYALKTMCNIVTGSASKIAKGEKLPWEPFGTNVLPTTFEVVFIFNGIKYTYGFSFDENKIHNEYLYYWPNGRKALIFSRNGNVYEFRDNVNEQITLGNRTPDNKLYLVSSNDWNLPQTENAYKWFQEKLIFLMNENYTYSKTIYEILRGEDQKSRVLKELLIADLGITDISIDDSYSQKPLITTTHRIIKEDGSSEFFQLSIDQESSGTKHFFSMLGGWFEALERGALLIVDEIENSLHPLLTKHLIEMILNNSINIAGAQLLFTTHDTMLMDLKYLRRDQIWFTEKNDKTCATELYPLSSFSPRKGEDVRKGYLQGRFGAIPFIAGDDY